MNSNGLCKLGWEVVTNSKKCGLTCGGQEEPMGSLREKLCLSVRASKAPSLPSPCCHRPFVQLRTGVGDLGGVGQESLRLCRHSQGFEKMKLPSSQIGACVCDDKFVLSPAIRKVEGVFLHQKLSEC